jgi:hypothetical protein
MLWVKCVLLATAWIISIFIATCISAQRQGCEALSGVVPTELRK